MFDTSSLNSLLRKLHRVEDSILAILLFGMIFFAVTQILLRNLFDSGIVWADPLLRIMVLWIGLLGALAATRENKHITIDLLPRFLSEKLREITKVFINLFSSIVTAIIAYHSVRFVMMDYEAQSEAFSNIPAWILESILPIAFGLISLRFMLHAVLNIHTLMIMRHKQ